VRIALDDFGTGYSSLSYLRSFPFDKLKMDRCFIHDLVDNPDSRALVTSMLDLARQFEMETIAEGVEDETQLALLRAMGCRQAQGFLFSRAIPARELPIERLTLPASNRRAFAINAPMPARAGEPRAVRRGSL
jgi:EAL domain-containing protein (putative c-di-GMP-specific phosphodiesterase class I)